MLGNSLKSCGRFIFSRWTFVECLISPFECYRKSTKRQDQTATAGASLLLPLLRRFWVIFLDFPISRIVLVPLMKVMKGLDQYLPHHHRRSRATVATGTSTLGCFCIFSPLFSSFLHETDENAASCPVVSFHQIIRHFKTFSHPCWGFWSVSKSLPHPAIMVSWM